MRPAIPLLVSCLSLSVSACSSSQPAAPIDVALRCPPISDDLVAESKRPPVIRGDTAVEIAARLVNQTRQKNRALKRAIAAHEECRGT
jgi:hypothetical protein